MKNLKKTLAVVLAFAMVLSMGFSAFAYTDVTAGTKVAEAVGILSNLGIFTGFEDGTFKPNDTVTRAQMAAIICRTLGYEDQANASTGTTIFNDVPASHWASGYINVAQSLQIVNGYGNGNFGPEDQVTYEQAIKMIVVALGYELDAQAKGGWSTGYLAVAAREGISKNSNGVVGTPAARGTIAVLVYNSLEVRLMDQQTWTPNGGDDEYGKLDETILSQYLGIRKVEGLVTSVPFSDYVKGYTEDMDVELSFASGAEYFVYEDGKLKDKPLSTLTYNASLVPEANNYAGKKVVAYVGEEQDDETGDFMVYAIAEKQGANKVTVISAAQLVSDNTDAKKIVYKELGATRKTELDLDTDVTVTAQFGKVAYDENNDLTSVETLDNTQELATFIGNVGNGGIITLISNDANSKIDFISVTVYTNEAVIEEVTEEDGVVMFNAYTSYCPADIDTEDEDVLSVVIKDGVVADVKDIVANDTVSVVDETNNGSFIVYYVSSKTVTGKVDSYGSDAVEIAGEEYELSPHAVAANYTNGTADLSGKDGIFFLNVDGQIAHDEATTDKNYGIIIAAGTEGRKSMIDVVLADGTTASYELKDNVTVDGTKTADTTVISTLKGYLSVNGTDWDEAAVADIDEDLVFDITVKNGKVTKLVSVASAGSANGKEFDEENMSYGNLSFNDATVVISVDETVVGALEADDFKVGKVADFFVDGEGEDFVLDAYDYDNNDIAGLVIGKYLTSAIAQNEAAVVVTDYRTKEIDDETAYVIVGYQAGKKVSYTILEDDLASGFVVADGFAAGNVILVGAANADGMISDLEVLYTRANGLASGIADKEDEYYYFGTLDYSAGKEPTASRFFLSSVSNQVKSGESTNEYDVNEGVVMRNSANYTLVDFSEGTDPEVSKKSKGTGLFSRYTQFTYTVFVRYFDDAQVEVIVYKD